MASHPPSEKWQVIQERVEKSASKIGRKAANLQELDSMLAGLPKGQLDLPVKVPSFFPVEDETLRAYLKQWAPEVEELWPQFLKVQAGKANTLSPEGIEILGKIQKHILDTFSNPDHPFKDDNLIKYLSTLDKDNLLMVRSTADEDSLDFANPGGNESVAAVAPTMKAVSAAMGVVIASYFSEKSIMQRMSRKKAFSSNVFMPVLVQTMIGESLNGEPNSNEVVRSGVIYATQDRVNIDVSPGHGELIVQGKGLAFDSYYVSLQDVVHEQRFDKTFRLVPVETQELDKLGNKKRKLLPLKNSQELAQAGSLPIVIAQKIAKIARAVQDHYGLAMDMEFVFDPKKKILYLVQARPIDRADDPHLEVPTSVPPAKLGELKKLKEGNQIALEKGELICPARLAAKLLTQTDEIIVANTLDEALREYLDPKKKLERKAPVKAIIVKHYDARSSHAAALFNSNAIPVLQLNDIENIKAWVKSDRFVLMMDPQRKQIIRFTPYITGENLGSAEKILKEQGFIKEGLFKAGVSIREKATDLKFRKFKGLQEGELKTIKSETMDAKQVSSLKLGELIQKTQDEKVDPEIALLAFQELMKRLFDLVAPLDLKNIKKVKGKNFIKFSLESIETVQPGQVKEAEEGLNTLLMVFAKMAKIPGLREGEPQFGLFRSALILCAELRYWLTVAGNMQPADKDWGRVQQEIQTLSGIVEGLVYSEGLQGSISDSIKQLKQEEQAVKKALKVAGEAKLEKESMGLFVELMNFQKIALKQEFAKEWETFCLEACRQPNTANLLSIMLKFARENSIDSDWLNDCFVRQYRKVSQTVSWNTALFGVSKQRQREKAGKSFANIENLKMRKILQGMKDETLKTEKELAELNLTQKHGILKKWEARFREWADPDNFDSLFKEFQQEVLPLIDQLDLPPNMQPLSKKGVLKAVRRLTEVIDNSIKALTGSSEYARDPELQVKRFTLLLEPFHKLMERWVKQIPENTFKGWSVISSNNREEILETISDTFKDLKENYEREQLIPSPNFSVASARIDSAANFDRQFTQRGTLSKASLWSLAHQNIYASLAAMGSENGFKITDLPEAVQPLVESLTKAMDLLFVEHEFPKLILEFNKSLQNHSAKFTLEYDLRTQKIVLHNKFFGHNRGQRMDKVAFLANLEADLWGLRKINVPKYHLPSFSLEYSYELEVNDVSKLKEGLFKAIQQYCEITFRPAIDEENISRILARHPGKEREVITGLLEYLDVDDIIKLNLGKNIKESLEFKADLIRKLLDKGGDFQIWDLEVIQFIKKFPDLYQRYQDYLKKEWIDKGKISGSFGELLIIHEFPELSETFSQALEKLPNFMNVLYEAIKNKAVNLAKRLLKAVPDWNILDSDGNTFLVLALKNNNFELAQYLIEKEVDLNIKGKFGQLPIFLVLSSDSTQKFELAKSMIERGVNPRVKTNIGDSLLEMAYKADVWELVKYLIELPKVPGMESDLKDLTVVLKEVFKDMLRRPDLTYLVERFKYLIEKGGNLFLEDRGGRSCFTEMLNHGRKELVWELFQYLLDHNKVDLKDSKIVDALLLAAVEENKLDFVKNLLKLTKVNVNAANWQGQTALMFAAQNLNEEMILLLEGQGIKSEAEHKQVLDVNLKNKRGQNVLNIILDGYGNTDVKLRLIKFFIRNKIDLEVVDGYRGTPLQSAIRNGFFEGVKLLVEAGANLDVKDDEGRSVIELAERRYKPEITEYLRKMIDERDQKAAAKDESSPKGPKF